MKTTIQAELKLIELDISFKLPGKPTVTGTFEVHPFGEQSAHPGRMFAQLDFGGADYQKLQEVCETLAASVLRMRNT